MAFLNWSSELSVGIPKIDQQPQKLVGFLNELYDDMQAGKGRDVLGKHIMETDKKYTGRS
jgi:hemerythrin